MKKIYALLFALTFSCISFGQTIFSENMGTPTGTTLIPAYITGTAPATFQNGSPIVYSGTADVRVTTPSNYTGASAGGNVWLAGVAVATPPVANKYFQIDGINTSAYSTANIQMSFGYLTSPATSLLVVEYSTNGTTWTPITFTNNTTTAWTFVTVAGGILPSSATLSLRFTGTTTGIRVDDIKVFNFNPACTLVLGAPVGVCNAVTSGIDTYTATIPYTGGGSGSYTITPSSGTVGGDNPATVAAGNIIVSGITEGTNLTMSIVSGVCTYSTLLSAPECKVINTLPYSETFPYAVSSSLGVQQKWTNVNTGDDIVSVANSLTYTGVTTAGNSVMFSGAGIECFTPFTTTTTGTVYASFLLNVSDLSNVTTDLTATYFAGITDNLKSYNARFFVKKNGTQYQLGFDTASTTTNYETTLRNVGTVVYIVVGYDYATNALSAWINPVNGSTPTFGINPTVPFVNLGGFILRQDGAASTPTIIFDELKIGTSLTDLGITLATKQNNEITGLKVYPNPVSNGILHIESNLNIERTISLFDVLGKQVISTTTSNTTLNIATLKSGVYIVKINEAGKTATRKLVVE
jgi:hypothetical protein